MILHIQYVKSNIKPESINHLIHSFTSIYFCKFIVWVQVLYNPQNLNLHNVFNSTLIYFNLLILKSKLSGLQFFFNLLLQWLKDRIRMRYLSEKR